MSPSALPAFIQALVTQSRAVVIPALAAQFELTVYNGWGVTQEPGNYLMIGVDNVLNPAPEGIGGHASQDWAHSNSAGHRNEIGTVTCAAYAWNGDDNPDEALADAFAIMAAVEAMLLANTTLGVNTLLWSLCGTSTDYSMQRGPDGASVVIIFQITFKARI